MLPSPFRCLYLTASCMALLVPALYLLSSATSIPLSPVSTVLLLFLLLTLPRLLFLSALLHRGFAHDAFTCASPLVEQSLQLLCLLSFHPYDLATWRQRHLHFHAASATLSTHAGSELKAKDVASPPPSPSAPVPPLLLRLFQLWLAEDGTAVQTQQQQRKSTAAGPLHHHLPAVAFNTVAFFLIHHALPLPSSSLLSSSLHLLLPLSLLCLSQLYLWLCSAFLLDHSLALPLLGYQLYLNAHYNSTLLSLLTLGGGYLNTHHAAPSSPLHTHLSPLLEPDPSHLLLSLLSSTSLISLLHPPLNPLPLPSPPSSSPSSPPSLLPPPLSFPSNLLLTGSVSHTRMWPFYHRFVYPVTYVCLELCPLTPVMLDPFPLWSSRSPSHAWALCRVNPDDYLSLPALRRMLVEGGVRWMGVVGGEERGGGKEGGEGLRVWVVTCGRYLGYAMNPISYYLCYDGEVGREGRGKLVCVVSEVHNTPWGEVCHYVHAVGEVEVGAGGEVWHVDRKEKKMHVSPFMSMHYTYTLRYTTPMHDGWRVRWAMHHTTLNPHTNHLHPQPTYSLSSPHPVHPEERKGGEEEGEKWKDGVEHRHFKAVLELRGERMTAASMVWNLVRFPLQSMRVVWLIYWQAAVLFVRKKAVFYSHPLPVQQLAAPHSGMWVK